MGWYVNELSICHQSVARFSNTGSWRSHVDDRSLCFKPQEWSSQSKSRSHVIVPRAFVLCGLHTHEEQSQFGSGREHVVAFRLQPYKD
jgi:hypothetical protein